MNAEWRSAVGRALLAILAEDEPGRTHRIVWPDERGEGDALAAPLARQHGGTWRWSPLPPASDGRAVATSGQSNGLPRPEAEGPEEGTR